ncbi:uncharacterized protein SCHCODRAFT_02639014 [Schizophyllum commune H4-8]|uniref:uncharacterized protein n=1 Tax=Schizophyllum commune (strain H4-8 / FGSC 9210) TaxID=578458 RepID=UPI0021609C26|nr:uncharacterized protein SCHCODRAFT_02639014 [Schizophyllum commune H4-8]KAI5887827.1 hypothetical protein SCHCODRAFT_02639014 [Schizophyllum commune H4-8]
MQRALRAICSRALDAPAFPLPCSHAPSPVCPLLRASTSFTNSLPPRVPPIVERSSIPSPSPRLPPLRLIEGARAGFRAVR